MKKEILLLVAIFLAACGDSVENVSQPNMDVVVSSSELTECSQKNEGDLAFVKEENAVRVCVDGIWAVTTESIVDSVDLRGDLSCATVELDDGSGFKIVCNGDSIGVVFNGQNGTNGADGKDGMNGRDGSDGKVPVLESDTLENDSERVALSLDSLAGYAQKGPFLKGAAVYLYELSDGRTLKQTNGNFTSKIEREDGRYKFAARDLVSQYAMIVVKGFYRNEVTGNPSDASIRLRALTDMRIRSSANINLLTHLEFDRVYYLVTREKKTVKQAKRQAQAEIFNAFHIDTTGFTGSSEDLDVFGPTDADAALLAISILMQREDNETALSVLLTEIANDMEIDGKWEDSTTKALIADWATTADMENRLIDFRNNVQGWGLGNGQVPDFEKIIRRFWSIENKLGVCGDRDNPVGIVKHVPNANSTTYYATDYSDISITKDRFICDSATRTWRLATDIEKDTVGLGSEHNDGDVARGKVNKDVLYIFDDGYWYPGTDQDSLMQMRCNEARKNVVVQGMDSEWYTCDGYFEMDSWHPCWRRATGIEKDTLNWGLDWNEGDVRNGQFDHYRTYVFHNGHWRLGMAMDSLLKQGCIEENMISDTVYEDYYYRCRNYSDSWKWTKLSFVENDTYIYQDECKEGGKYSDGSFILGRMSERTYVCDNGKFRSLNNNEFYIGKGCVSYLLDSSIVIDGRMSYYKCTAGGWEFDIEKNTGSVEIDGVEYRTITIENQVWMADNLNIETEGSYCYNDSVEYCSMYGRLYTWEEAMTVCPTGWHLPDSTEWETLLDAANGFAGYSGYPLMSPTGWKKGGLTRSGMGILGFSALPAGYRNNLYYVGVGEYAYFWSAHDLADGSADVLYMFYKSYGAGTMSRSKYFSHSVRCVQD